MDLNKLRTFTVVAEHQSISKAAEALYRTQPAISQQLKALETELGLTLFERRNARVFLTREGQALYADAARHIGALDDAALRLREDRRLAEGLIRILVESDTVAHLLPGLIKDFGDEFPNVRFDIRSSRYAQIDERLLNNEADFAFMVLYTQRAFFSTHPFVTLTRSLAAAAELAASAKIRSVTDLAQLKHVGFMSPHGDLRFWLKKNGHSQHVSALEKTVRSSIVHDAHTLNHMVLAGAGSGFVFDSTIDAAVFNDGRLVRLLPDNAPIKVTVDLAYRKARNETYIQEAFRQFVLDRRAQLA